MCRHVGERAREREEGRGGRKREGGEERERERGEGREREGERGKRKIILCCGWLARLDQIHTTHTRVCVCVVAIQTSILVYHSLIPDPKATLA